MGTGIPVGFLCAAAGYLLLGFPAILPMAILGVAVAHGGISANWLFSTTLLQQCTEDRFRGRVFSAELGLLMPAISSSGYLAGTAIDCGIAPRTFAIGVGAAMLLPALLWRRASGWLKKAG